MAAAAKKTASSYYQWSDDEKRRYYTEFEAVPRNSHEAWLKEHWPGNRSQFYRNRTAFLKAHPDFELGATSLKEKVSAKKRLQTMRKQKNALPRERQLAQAAHAREVLAAQRADAKRLPSVRMARDFRAADKAGKQAILKEYLALPDSAKLAFREQHNMSQALVNYYAKAKPKPVIPTDDDTQAYLDEYLSLRGRSSKQAWLIEHGLNHKVMYEVRHKGRSLYSVAKFKPKLSTRALVPSSNFHAQILPAPPQQIPSLDDAITAMEVERDQLSAFIERLKRFRNVR